MLLILQILVNRDRLVKRLHQQRSAYRILGKPNNEADSKDGENGVVEDDDDDVEVMYVPVLPNFLGFVFFN